MIMMLSKLFLEKKRKEKKCFFVFFFVFFVFFFGLLIFSSIVILDATTHLIRVDAEVEWYNSIVATKDDDDDDDASTVFSVGVVPFVDRFLGVDVRALGGVGDRLRRGIS